MNRPVCHVQWLGRVGYEEALQRQRGLLERRIAGAIPDTLLLLEHPPVITIGKLGEARQILADEAQLKARGVEVHQSDRGGETTYHGPGQVVGYPIVGLKEMRPDVGWYVRGLEEVMIRTAQNWGVTAERMEEKSGAWVGTRKIGAVGVRVQRWTTMHGFAFNVAVDPGWFDLIVPCGIRDMGVTSLSAELERKIPVGEVRERLAERFGEVFDRKMVHVQSE